MTLQFHDNLYVKGNFKLKSYFRSLDGSITGRNKTNFFLRFSVIQYFNFLVCVYSTLKQSVILKAMLASMWLLLWHKRRIEITNYEKEFWGSRNWSNLKLWIRLKKKPWIKGKNYGLLTMLEIDLFTRSHEGMQAK